MKHIYFIAVFVLFSLFSFSAPVNTVVANNGKWWQTTTWSQGRLPINGDTVVIPKNITLVVDNNLDITTVNLYIKIKGILNLNVGKLNLGVNSVIVIDSTGQIKTAKNNSSDKILIVGVPKYLGSEGTLSGPAVASKTTGSSPYGFAAFSPTPLPVKYLGFSVAQQNNDVLIQWSTSEEVNADQYEVERSFDASNWNRIAAVAAKGNSSNVNNYAYTDRSVASKVIYYRIKQTDFSGKATYTAIKSIKAATTADIKVASMQSKLVLQFPQQIQNSVTVRLISLSGQVVSEQKIAQPIGQVVLNTTVRGNYVVSVSNGNNVNIARQVAL
ncbi:MAG: G8 domain-containing protein [Flavisolibacter sp.]